MTAVLISDICWEDSVEELMKKHQNLIPIKSQKEDPHVVDSKYYSLGQET
jgi:hypothetical protein